MLSTSAKWYIINPQKKSGFGFSSSKTENNWMKASQSANLMFLDSDLFSKGHFEKTK